MMTSKTFVQNLGLSNQMPQIGGNNAQVTSHDKQAVGTSVPHLEDQLH
jgi:hypothetical protein